jgi:hypothetical protein
MHLPHLWESTGNSQLHNGLLFCDVNPSWRLKWLEGYSKRDEAKFREFASEIATERKCNSFGKFALKPFWIGIGRRHGYRVRSFSHLIIVLGYSSKRESF